MMVAWKTGEEEVMVAWMTGEKEMITQQYSLSRSVFAKLSRVHIELVC